MLFLHISATLLLIYAQALSILTFSYWVTFAGWCGVSMLLDILGELVDHAQLCLLLWALGQQFRVLNFHRIDATLQDADLSDWLPYHLAVLQRV